MSAGVRVKQAIKRGIEVIFSAVGEQLVDQFRELFFPEGIFQLAARFREAGRQSSKFGRIGRDALA